MNINEWRKAIEREVSELDNLGQPEYDQDMVQLLATTWINPDDLLQCQHSKCFLYQNGKLYIDTRYQRYHADMTTDFEKDHIEFEKGGELGDYTGLVGRVAPLQEAMRESFDTMHLDPPQTDAMVVGFWGLKLDLGELESCIQDLLKNGHIGRNAFVSTDIIKTIPITELHSFKTQAMSPEELAQRQAENDAKRQGHLMAGGNKKGTGLMPARQKSSGENPGERYWAVGSESKEKIINLISEDIDE